MDPILLPAPLMDPRESLLEPRRLLAERRGDSRRHSSQPPPPASVLREPVRLLAPTVESPFAPGREVTLALVAGSLLDPLGVRDGDHVALARRDKAEHGDLAAVVGSDGRAALWKVYPVVHPEGVEPGVCPGVYPEGGESLRLSTGDPVWTRRTAGRARVTGVVVGVLRRFAR